MLLRGLPPEALYLTPVGHPEMAAWTPKVEMFAQLIDVIVVMAHDKRYDGEPWRVPRPEFLDPKKGKRRSAVSGQEVSTPSEIAAFLSGGRGGPVAIGG